MLKASIGKLLAASPESAKTVAEFNGKVAATKAEITQMDWAKHVQCRQENHRGYGLELQQAYQPAV